MNTEAKISISVGIPRVTVDRIIDLRQKILFPGFEKNIAFYNEDRHPTTCHFGAFLTDHTNKEKGGAIGCVTFILNTRQEDLIVWELRGVVIDSHYQRRGLGKLLLNEALQDLKSESLISTFWCFVPELSVGFFEKCGWKVVSGEISNHPILGLKLKMKKYF